MLIDKLFTPEQLAFCRALPKVELHAHLNGSIRESTMVELAQRLPGGSAKLPQLQQGALRSKACRPPAPPSRPPNAPSESIQQKSPPPPAARAAGIRALHECFLRFDTIHAITTQHEVVTRITREALEDCEADGVVYVELRTTPKARSAACGHLATASLKKLELPA